MALEFDTTNSIISNEAGGGGIKVSPGTSEIVTVENGILIPDGTKTEPAVRFTDDNNTGIYSPVDDTVSITGQGEDVAQFEGTVSAVNHTKTKSGATGNGPTISAEGTDTNIDLNIDSKGTGTVTIDGLKYPTADGTANQVIETDGAGNLSFVDAGAGGGGATVLNDLTDVTLSAQPSARYWRLNWTENNGDVTFTEIAEFGLRIVASGPSVATGGTAFSETNHASFPPTNAFDNNVTSEYLTVAGSPIGYLGYDFGAGNEKIILEYTVQLGDAIGVLAAPKSWTLEYSNDGVNYTTLKTESNQTGWSVNEERVFSSIASISANDLLKYDGISAWTASTIELSDLNNVVLDTPTLNDNLTFNGTQWINQAATGSADSRIITFPTPISVDPTLGSTGGAIGVMAIGDGAQAGFGQTTGSYQLAIGTNAYAGKYADLSIGSYSNNTSYGARNSGGTSVGHNSETNGSGVAIGRDANTNSNNVAIGYGSMATGTVGSISIGGGVTSSGKKQIIIGSAGSSIPSTAIGETVISSNTYGWDSDYRKAYGGTLQLFGKCYSGNNNVCQLDTANGVNSDYHTTYYNTLYFFEAQVIMKQVGVGNNATDHKVFKISWCVEHDNDGSNAVVSSVVTNVMHSRGSVTNWVVDIVDEITETRGASYGIRCTSDTGIEVGCVAHCTFTKFYGA